MAEKIATLNLKILANHDVFGFLNDVSHQIDDTFSTKPECIHAFMEAQKAFDEALKGCDAVISAEEISAADRDADLAWSCLNAYLKVMLSHPIAQKRDAAEKIFQVFSKYENPTALAYATEYGILERLLSELKTIPKETLDMAGAAEWIHDLDAKCARFIQLYSLRVQDKATRVTGATKTARLNAIDTYREMVKLINALLIVSPTDELSRFASHLNELISAKQIAIKSKKTKSGNANGNSSVELIENPDGSIGGIIQ